MDKHIHRGASLLKMLCLSLEKMEKDKKRIVIEYFANKFLYIYSTFMDRGVEEERGMVEGGKLILPKMNQFIIFVNLLVTT